MAASSWKETYFLHAPGWANAVMANGFRTPLGCFAMTGTLPNCSMTITCRSLPRKTFDEVSLIFYQSCLMHQLNFSDQPCSHTPCDREFRHIYLIANRARGGIHVQVFLGCHSGFLLANTFLALFSLLCQ